MTIDASKHKRNDHASADSGKQLDTTAVASPSDNSLKQDSNVKKPRSNAFFVGITFIFTIGAYAACYYLWQLQNQLQQSHASEIAELKRSFRTLDEHPTITEFKNLTAEQNARFSQQLNDLSNLTNTLESSISKTLDLAGRNHRDWVLAEVEYLIRMAHTQMQLMRDSKSAIIALLNADQRISTLADPRLLPIRKSIANEITQLKNLSLPDVDGALLRLSDISRRLPNLPLATVSYEANNVQDNIKIISSADEVASISWWSSIITAIKNLIGFRADAKASSETLAKNNIYYLDQILRLEIESARQAALRLDKSDFEYRLSAIKTLLDQHYDQTNIHVITIKQDIVALQQLPVFPAIPDLTSSLDALLTFINSHPTQMP